MYFTDEPEHVVLLRETLHQRHMRDVLGMPIVGGSSNMQKNNIANRLGLAG